MRVTVAAVFLISYLSGTAVFAQDKIAEGEYEISGTSPAGASVTKTVSRWVLTGRSTGGFHLESEIQGQPQGMRIVQIEELDQRYVPVTIGYELYREGQKVPSLSANCNLSGAVTCTGASGADRAKPSKPYKPVGPFWLYMDGVTSIDLPWLLSGAVNMAHLENGKVDVATLSVFGGTAVMLGDAVNVARLQAVMRPGQTLNVVAPQKPIPWELSIKEESPLEIIGKETIEINKTEIAVKHYRYVSGNDAMNLWTAGNGIVVKLANFTLVNYKQYRQLIPELATESQATELPPPQVH